jgi:cell division protein FtsL
MKKRKRKFNWFFLLLLVIVGVFSYSAIKQQLHSNEIAQEKKAAEIRLMTAQQLNSDLMQEKVNLEQSTCIEKIAREELGMVKPGEMPYISSAQK